MENFGAGKNDYDDQEGSGLGYMIVRSVQYIKWYFQNPITLVHDPMMMMTMSLSGSLDKRDPGAT